MQSPPWHIHKNMQDVCHLPRDQEVTKEADKIASITELLICGR